MEESLKKWERWLEQSLRLDTGYPKIMVRSSTTLKEDVSIWRNGDVLRSKSVQRLGINRKGSRMRTTRRCG